MLNHRKASSLICRRLGRGRCCGRGLECGIALESTHDHSHAEFGRGRGAAGGAGESQ